MRTMTESATDWPVLTAEDFQLDDHVGERVLPIFEDEAAFGVYGYGHWDKSQFAEVVNEYDRRGVPNEPQVADAYHAHDVHHVWAVVTDPETQAFTWRNITADTPFAFPVTLIKR